MILCLLHVAKGQLWTSATPDVVLKNTSRLTCSPPLHMGDWVRYPSERVVKDSYQQVTT